MKSILYLSIPDRLEKTVFPEKYRSCFYSICVLSLFKYFLERPKSIKINYEQVFISDSNKTLSCLMSPWI